MIALVLGALALVGIGVAASSSGSSGPSPAPTGVGLDLLVSSALLPTRPFAPPADLAAAMAAKGYHWEEGLEKFADPRMRECWGPEEASANPYVTVRWPFDTGQGVVEETGIPLPNGLEYLGGVPPTAAARVELLRARVSEFALLPSAQVEASAKASAKALYVAAQGLVGELQTSEGQAAVAKRLGVPIDQILDAEEQIAAGLQKLAGGKLDFRSLIRDLNGAVVEVLQRVLRQLLDVVSKAVGSAVSASTMALASAFGSALGSWLPIVQSLWTMFLEQQAARGAVIAEQRRAWVETNITARLDELGSYGWPLPWHLFDLYDLAFPDGDALVSGGQEAVADALRDTIADWQGLGLMATAPAARWWAAATATMADPQVQSVFRALGRDSAGGVLASDEQVVAVATPIAVLRGLDPWEFSRLLWGYARGWRAFDRRYGGADKGTARPQTFAHWSCPESHWYSKAEGCDIDRQLVICRDTPANAWAMNLADLSRAAWVLADQVRPPLDLQVSVDLMPGRKWI